MTNKVAAANDALWGLVQTVFAGYATIVRNPTEQVPPKPRAGGISSYVEMVDGLDPHIIDVLLGGPTYDLRILPEVTVAFVGPENLRRSAATAAIEALKAALAADPHIGGAVDDARLDIPRDAGATGGLEWLAGGRTIPVRLLFSAPSAAG